MDQAVIAVDIGTSGVRAVAFSDRLRVLREAQQRYSFEATATGGAEQNVGQVIRATLACIKEVVAQVGRAQVLALSLSGTASCLAAFGPASPASTASGEAGNAYTPLGPAWIWADIRARREAAALTHALGSDAYLRTGCPAHASYWPAKLKWWQAQRQDLLEEAGLVLAGIKDYLFYWLTGEWLVDETIAATTGLYDSQRGTWDAPILDWLALSSDTLPRVVGVTEQRPLLSASAERLGLEKATPVVIGSMDGVLAHLGAGCRSPAVASCMIGTSGAVRLGAAHRMVDDKTRPWSYPLTATYWVTGGATNNGGNILAWLGSLFQGLAGGEEASRRLNPEALLALAAQAKPGAEGLLFLPYVYGERSPLWREDLSGTWVGLAPNHGAPELVRAVVEGISLNLASILEALVDQLGAPEEVRAVGGFTASETWLQVQADVFGLPISLTSPNQPTAAGAAILGWSALTDTAPGIWTEHITVEKTIQPNPENRGRYQELYGQFISMRARLL